MSSVPWQTEQFMVYNFMPSIRLSSVAGRGLLERGARFSIEASMALLAMRVSMLPGFASALVGKKPSARKAKPPRIITARVMTTPRTKFRISSSNLCRLVKNHRRETRSVSLQFAGFADDITHLGQEVFLLRRGERHRRILRGDPHDRSVEIVESFLMNDGADLSRDASCANILVQHDYFVRPAHRPGNRLAVERRQRSQIHDLQFNAFLGQDLGRFQRDVHHRRISDNAQV